MSDKDQAIKHWGSDEFRKHGYAVIDWLASYVDQIETLPVQSQVSPGDIRDKLPDHAPQEGEPFDVLMGDLDAIIVPGLMNWQSPNFFGYFPANGSPPSILGELLSAGLGQQGMLWQTSPACTELEAQVLDWMVDMLALPDAFRSNSDGGGVIQDSASSATLCALLAARERTQPRGARDAGIDPRLVMYCSTQSHSSVEKAAAIAGFGGQRLRKIGVDSEQRMDVALLRSQIEADLADGLLPTFVCATIGTTSSLAIDPCLEIGEICRHHDIWLHVDAAMAGTAALCPEFRYIHRGLELADSYCVNPHKWMLTNFDCDCFFVSERKSLISALSVLPEYLRNAATEAGGVIDYRDWQIPLGRRFRALKLWFVIRSYGINALGGMVRHHVNLAKSFAERVSSDERFELVTTPSLNLVCFRLIASDDLNRQLLATINESGAMFMSHTVIGDTYTLRFCVGQSYTETRHVEAAWLQLVETATRLMEVGE